MAANPGRKRPVRRRPKKEEPNPIDIHVGRRLRVRRKLMGFSQGSLGERIGLTFQQVQKYENGANRIGASRLWELSLLLDVPVQYFFDEISDDTVERMKVIIGDPPPGLSERPAPYVTDWVMQPGVLEIARDLNIIHNPTIRRHIAGLVSSLADQHDGDAVLSDEG